MTLIALKNYQRNIIEKCLTGDLECFPKLRGQISNLWVEEESSNQLHGALHLRYLGDANNITSGKYKDFEISDTVVWFNEFNGPAYVDLKVWKGEIYKLEIGLSAFVESDHNDRSDFLQIEKVGWLTYEAIGTGFKETEVCVFDSNKRNFDGALGYYFPTYSDS